MEIRFISLPEPPAVRRIPARTTSACRGIKARRDTDGPFRAAISHDTLTARLPHFPPVSLPLPPHEPPTRPGVAQRPGRRITSARASRPRPVNTSGAPPATSAPPPIAFSRDSTGASPASAPSCPRASATRAAGSSPRAPTGRTRPTRSSRSPARPPAARRARGSPPSHGRGGCAAELDQGHVQPGRTPENPPGGRTSLTSSTPSRPAARAPRHLDERACSLRHPILSIAPRDARG
jgi:hypothetical protein